MIDVIRKYQYTLLMSLVLLFALLISINILLGLPEVEYHQHIGIILQLLFGIGSIYYSILVSRSGIKDSNRLHVEKPWYVEKTAQVGVMTVSFLFAFVLIIMNMIILGIGFAFIGIYFNSYKFNVMTCQIVEFVLDFETLL